MFAETVAVVRVVDEDHEVDVQVKLKLLGLEVTSEHLLWHQLLPGLEEFSRLAPVE